MHNQQEVNMNLPSFKKIKNKYKWKGKKNRAITEAHFQLVQSS